MYLLPKNKSNKQADTTNEYLQKVVSALRSYLKDFEETNHLLEGEEFTDTELRTFLLMALDHFNNRVTPLSITVTITTFPSLSLWLDGAAIYSLKSAIFKYQRNSFQYNDSGTQVMAEEKAPEYERTLQRMMAEWIQDARAIKESINLEGCYGGITSEYLDLYTTGYRGNKGGMI